MANKNNKYDEYGFRIQPTKTVVKPTTSTTEQEKNAKNRKIIFIIIAIIVGIAIICGSILSGFIAWNCYGDNLKYVRIVKTVLAVCFSYLYLPYFFILRVILKQPCF